MTVEELLKPRYKVIAQYPNTPYEISDLVNISDDGNLFHAITTWVGPDGQLIEQQKYYHSIETLQKYPHLFKQLEWWEDRKLEEMPEYVKRVNGQEGVSGVIPFSMFRKEYEPYEDAELEWTCGSYHISLFVPATEAEYTNYINSKQNG